ncbi:hypothetical protein BDZ94DRAFT_1258412 [Collybia nuda]|uniref:Uncharacterized protein n=1 Tax=Collybia nuda TaxID=64659 RepID=A0A9P5Y6S5_9AGAR|nr:hypothetical protein BDZ94DRAFT_1258412 [Collybia nuda]
MARALIIGTFFHECPPRLSLAAKGCVAHSSCKARVSFLVVLPHVQRFPKPLHHWLTPTATHVETNTRRPTNATTIPSDITI